MLRFNENNEVIRQDEYKAILVGLQRDREEDISYSMEELKGLAEAANAEVLGMMTQNLERPNTATLIGKGKVEELAELVKNMEADTVIFNDELSGMQLRNLEDALDVRVIDRTILILDIFADRASSREGKLQVELAQLQYRMPRLIGFGKSLSRLGGGSGTRGPGKRSWKPTAVTLKSGCWTSRRNWIRLRTPEVCSVPAVKRTKFRLWLWLATPTPVSLH